LATSIQICVITVGYLKTTDRRTTDGRTEIGLHTTYCRITALCVASCSKRFF